MRSKSHLKALHLLLLSFALFLTIGLGGPTLLRAIEPAHSDLDAVWQRVQQSGAYRFSADMTQTDTPLATVRNAGRQGRVSTYFMQGETNLAAEMLHLMIWSESGSTLLPDSGMELEVDGHRARSRQGDGDWQAVDDFSGLFAPGGDFLAYSRMAKNVALHEPERRSTVAGEVEVTRFSFELDGRAYAMEMTKQMRAQAAREGLPASVRFDLPKVYKEMTGTGELWVGADGLPLRQLFAMNFPETGENSISSVEVTVDFSDFAELPSVGWQRWVQPWLRSATRAAVVPESWLMLFAVALVLVGIALLVAHRRARPVYVAVVVAAIGAMVAVPLLNGHQIHAYGIRQQAKQEKQKAERTRGEAAEQMRAALRTIDFAPNRAPLERAQKEAAHEEAALAVMQQDNDDDDDDEEYDGRYFEESCETDPNGDADGDTLTNLEECLLGTLTTVADTDEDGLDDNLEVAGFSYGGQIWYTNPLEIDSNRDGLDDGKEWLLDVDKNGVPDDTDGDGTPDLWDEDNDGDGAPDDLDLSVYIHTGGESAARIGESKRFDEEKPLQLRFNELQAGELIDVEFQLTPTNPEHLWYSRNVLDWPMNDKQGQIQDVDGATFYDLNSNLDPSPNDNGDMRMVPMLEIEMPADSANLPPAESCITEEGKTVDCYPLLDQFGIAVQQTSENALAAYVPLQLVSDSSGDEKVAFYGRMLYQASGLWRDAHDVRLVWVIQALNDICEVYKDNICQSYSDYNELQIVQTYYDEWSLTGLMLTEEHNADVALIYEEPAQVEAEPDAYGAPLYLDNLYQLLYGLDFSFLAGRDCESVDADGDCVGNGERDITVPEIARRFDHATNGDVSDDERWGMPNVFSVVTNEYESLDLGAMDTAITQTVQVLDDVFTERWSANEPITPTIMVATEHSYRAFNFDQIIGDPTNLKWDANLLTINLAQGGEHAVGVETVASLKWTPYAYDPVDGWEAAEIIGYWDTLTAQLGNRFDDYADEEEVETYHTMAQVLYLAVHQGSSSVVESDGLIYSQSYQGLDKEIMKGIAAPTKRAL